MAELELQVETRLTAGKGTARKLRRQGMLPAVMYGQSPDQHLLLQVPSHTFMKELGKEARGRLVSLKVGRKKHTVLVKDLQEDPVRGDVIHIDFQAVGLDEEVQTQAPIVLVGEENRERDGGIVSQTLREAQIACLAANIPDSLEVDVSSLKLNETLTVADIQAPEGVRILDDPDVTVVTILAPRRASVSAAASEEGEEGGQEDGGEAEQSE